MKQVIKDFINDESGATMVEYAILVALISVAVIATVGLLQVAINDAFQSVVDELNGAVDGGGTTGGTTGGT